jgi:hypothetical protein
MYSKVCEDVLQGGEHATVLQCRVGMLSNRATVNLTVWASIHGLRIARVTKTPAIFGT